MFTSRTNREPGGSLCSSTSVGLTTAAARAVLSLTTTAGGLAAGAVSGLAGQVAQRLREAIQLGILLDGERLPPEAKLAEQLGVSTVTLREALAVLREQGLVVTRRGRGGGTFVTAADLDSALGRRLRALSVAQVRDLGDHRGAISAMTARLAAQRALPAEVADSSASSTGCARPAAPATGVAPRSSSVWRLRPRRSRPAC